VRRAEVVAAVFLGGCAGGLVRYVEVQAWPTGSSGFPSSTLAVNLVGALLLAAFVTWADRARHGGLSRALLGTGFCGAYTTFSSIVVDADRLIAHGAWGTATGYVAASFAGGVAAAVVGMLTTDWLHRRLTVSDGRP
jgi:CrcB protein